MSINDSLKYSRQKDVVFGFADFGQEERTKDIATHALVFMVRGVGRKWKQIIGFFLYKTSIPWDRLKQLLYKGLEFCHEARLTVVAVICDQETNQVRLWRELGVTINHPLILHPSDKSPVAIIFDPPHLLKNARNNLKNHDIEVSDHDFHFHCCRGMHCMKCIWVRFSKMWQMMFSTNFLVNIFNKWITVCTIVFLTYSSQIQKPVGGTYFNCGVLNHDQNSKQPGKSVQSTCTCLQAQRCL